MNVFCPDMALPLLQDAAIVFIVEVFVDWIKHAFITKLSELSASVSISFSSAFVLFVVFRNAFFLI